jgi:hypothetical protein
MDWMLAVVKRSSDEAVVYRVSESKAMEVSETVFADDASLYQRSLKSMQSILWRLACSFVDSQVCTATLENVGRWQLLALTSAMGTSCMERSGFPVVDGM